MKQKQPSYNFSGRRRVLLLLLIMITVTVGATGFTLFFLYNAAFEQQRERLIETVQSQARLIEAIAAFDAKHNTGDMPGDALTSTLSQMRFAHERFQEFGETGEFTLARREADQIVFLLRHWNTNLDNREPVPFTSPGAEPMRRALLGDAGILVGLDYRGQTVLAAYEPVAVLDLGIVAKIDLAEIRAPFIRAGLLAGCVSFVLIILGVVLFLKISNPILRHLHESKEFYNTIVESMSDGIMVLDDTFCYTYWNREMERISKVPREALVGQNKKPWDVFPYVMAEGVDRMMQRAMHGEIVGREDICFRTPNGTEGITSETYLPQCNETGEVVGVVGIIRDITARNRAEKALIEEQHYLQAILDTAIEGIITTDEQLFVESFNPASEKIFGYTAEEVIGCSMMKLIPLSDREGYETYLQMYQQTRNESVMGVGREVFGTRKDGSTFPAELAVSEACLEQRRLYTCFVRDISERRRLERELLDISEQESQRIGRDLHDGLGSLLTGVAMRTQALSQALAKGQPIKAKDLERIAEWIEEGSSHAQALARGFNPVTLETESLSAAMQELALMVQNMTGISCIFEGTEALPRIQGTVATQLYRIAQEAVHNAAKHAQCKCIQIHLAVETDHLILTVHDDGVGFPQDVCADAGMGLHIMPYRAHIIGAYFSIKSTPGVGTLVSCTLPMEQITCRSTSD